MQTTTKQTSERTSSCVVAAVVLVVDVIIAGVDGASLALLSLATRTLLIGRRLSFVSDDRGVTSGDDDDDEVNEDDDASLSLLFVNGNAECVAGADRCCDGVAADAAKLVSLDEAARWFEATTTTPAVGDEPPRVNDDSEYDESAPDSLNAASSLRSDDDSSSEPVSRLTLRRCRAVLLGVVSVGNVDGKNASLRVLLGSAPIPSSSSLKWSSNVSFPSPSSCSASDVGDE